MEGAGARRWQIAIALAAFDFNVDGELVLAEQAFVRLNANGTLDPTFSGDGLAIVHIHTSDVAFLPNGGYYAGQGWQYSTLHEVRKRLPSGAPDTSFSGDGVTPILIAEHLGVYLQVDTAGRPLLATRQTLQPYSWLIARWTTTGQPDPDYGGGDGEVYLNVPDADRTAGFLFNMKPDGTFWLASRSALDASVLDVYSLDAAGNPNLGWGAGASHHDVGFTVDFNRMTLGGGRVRWRCRRAVPSPQSSRWPPASDPVPKESSPWMTSSGASRISKRWWRNSTV